MIATTNRQLVTKQVRATQRFDSFARLRAAMGTPQLRTVFQKVLERARPLDDPQLLVNLAVQFSGALPDIGGESASVNITFTGGAAQTILLAAQRRGITVEHALSRAICQDVCCWLFDGEPESEPEVAAMFGLNTEEKRR